MLESIQIRDFAIIDAVQLELDQGMTALTGETGAGKSILLDALHPASAWLQENDMSAGDECVLRRVLYANGRSKAFINGSNATLMQLRALCDLLIDIHGQHEHQSLQKPAVQRELLDTYLGEPALISELRDKYLAYRALEKRLQQARSGSQQREQRIDLLELYCAELRELDLAEGEYENLQQEYRRLSNAGRLIEQSSEVLGLLYENEEHNLQSALAHCEQRLGELLASDPALASPHELLGAALIQVQEASAELRGYLDGIELDAERLHAVDDRIARVQQLARKHRVEATQLAALRGELENELADLRGDGQNIGTLEAELEKSREDYEFSAAELSLKRRQTAADLSEQITRVMQQLGMENGRCLIEVVDANAAAETARQGGLGRRTIAHQPRDPGDHERIVAHSDPDIRRGRQRRRRRCRRDRRPQTAPAGRRPPGAVRDSPAPGRVPGPSPFSSRQAQPGGRHHDRGDRARRRRAPRRDCPYARRGSRHGTVTRPRQRDDGEPGIIGLARGPRERFSAPQMAAAYCRASAVSATGRLYFSLKWP